MIEIAMLGCGGGMPMPNRYLSAALINYKGRKILVDCGEGTQVSMRMLGWGFKTVDVICITHCHGDHIVGLPGLLATIGNSGRVEPLTIIGPKGIEEVVNGLRVIAQFLPYEVIIIEDSREIKFNVGNDNIVTIDNSKGDIILNTIELNHSSNCIGYSFYINRMAKFNIEKAMANNVPKQLWNIIQKQGEVESLGIKYTPDMVLGDDRRGIKITYITDTRPEEYIVDFIKESDLFICEGTYGDDADIQKAIKNKHMTFREAGNLAKEGNVRELLLTHFSPAMVEPTEFINNAKDQFEKVDLAFDRRIKSLNFVD